MAIDHDQNFKNLILDYPRDALAFFAPEEAPTPKEQARIVPVRQEQLKERLKNTWRALDVPLLVEWPDRQRKSVAFVLEEESDPHIFSPHRLARYCLDLSEFHKTERVVPVVVFLHSSKSTPESLTLRTERDQYLAFKWVSCRLDQLPADQWRDSDNLVARLNLPNMRVPAGARVQTYADAFRGLRDLEADPDLRMKYLDFIDMYAELTENERQEFERRHAEENEAMVGMVQRARDEGREQGRGEMVGMVQRARNEGREQGRAEMVGAAQQARDEGREQGHGEGMERGRVEGMERGRVEGERAVVERLLRRRFGKLSKSASERLVTASTTDLERWADKVLDADSLEDVFSGP